MLQLRVLTGRHAGALLDWSSSRLTVGASEDLDVYIGDWSALQIELVCDDEGRLRARWRDGAHGFDVPGRRKEAEHWWCPLQHGVPVRFGDVILCVGRVDAPWPSDAELLARYFVPPAHDAGAGSAPRPPRPSAGRRIVTGALAVCTLAASPSSTLPGTTVSASAPTSPAATAATAHGPAAPDAPLTASPAPAEETMLQLRHALGAGAGADLSLERSGDRVVVRGVVPSRAAVDELNRLLDRQSVATSISRRFMAAPDVIDRLYEALPGDGLQIRDKGQGRFEVSGRAAERAAVVKVLEQVSADLAEFGVRVDRVLEPAADPLPRMSGLLIDSQGASILRTRDGVKHILAGSTHRRAVSPPAEGTP